MWSASWLLCEFVSTSELCQCVLCVLLLARPLTSISTLTAGLQGKIIVS